ncbi:actin family [Mrakia frigida]|uniref:actin family protein n=1 Tax=Mrakia frigida TaxID=29902 RepID=UPI003FCBFCA8
MASHSGPVLIVDNGASTIKAGFAGVPFDPLVIPNSIARSKQEKKSFVGDEIFHAKDFSAITYRVPFDRGYLVGWDAEKPIWDRLFLSDQGLNVDPSITSLLVTEPYNNLPSLQASYDQIVFEEYEFESYHRTTPAALVPYQPSLLFPSLASTSRSQPALSFPECYVLVDAGYSYTHIIPIMEGKVVHSAIKRIDVGGKLLTNHLKTLISFRHWNMMDQTHVVNEAKEKCCFVSDDFRRDLDICRLDPRSNPIVQEYALPDFTSTFKNGYIKRGPNAEPSPRAIAAAAALAAKNKTDPSILAPPPAVPDDAMAVDEEEDQMLPLGNERFSVPEVLFNPTDIGLPQVGIPEAIAQSIALLPEDLQGMFWSNIGVFGGSTLFPGFKERLQTTLQTISPSYVSPRVFVADRPLLTPYLAADALAKSPEHYRPLVVTRADYLEFGSEGIRKRFAKMSTDVAGVPLEGFVPAAPAVQPRPPPPPSSAPARASPAVARAQAQAPAPPKILTTLAGTPAKPNLGTGPGRGWRLGKGKAAANTSATG